MHPWLIFLQTFPIVAVLLFLVVGRRPPWQAALAGVFAARRLPLPLPAWRSCRGAPWGWQRLREPRF